MSPSVAYASRMPNGRMVEVIEVLLFIVVYLIIAFVVGVIVEVIELGGDGWEGLAFGLCWPLSIPIIIVVFVTMTLANAASWSIHSVSGAIRKWLHRG